VKPNDVREALETAVRKDGGAASGADRLCVACVAVLQVDGAALSVTHDGSSRGTFGASGDLSRHLDELQFTFGEGPCLDSVRDRFPVLVPDLRDPTETRWPAYSEAALDLGVRAVYALPVSVDSGRGAALDLYCMAPRRLTSADLAGGLLAAELAALPLFDLLAVEAGWAAAGYGPDGWAPPGFLQRVEVYQATGMIMGQLDVGPTDALLRLRAHAFTEGITATEVAWQIIDRRLSLEPDDAWPSQDPRGGGTS